MTSAPDTPARAQPAPTPAAPLTRADAAAPLEREAAHALAEARGLVATLHEAGQRALHRARLGRAIELADRAIARARPEADGAAVAGARATLALAHAARADDALHGARQLSLSAQRAPTREACDAGWQRVEGIAAVAEDSARAAATASAALELFAPGSALARAARAAAGRAAAAASAARELVEARNHAYTFHTDGGFSFGEGWYVAAAAVLADVAIQVEPGRSGTPQAERFLRDAGLSARVQPYRPRPRAVKQTTAIVARAFAGDPRAAQQKLRAAFLGDDVIPAAVVAWADAKLAGAAGAQTVLVWVRDGVHHAHRNTPVAELAQLAERARQAGLVPVLIGEAVRDGELPHGAIDLTLFSRDPVFRHDATRRAQLQLFEHLKRRHGLVGQLGVTTAGMDGPALMGLATMYLTDAPNVRMGEWVGAVPGYQEVVREAGYLERVGSALRAWARAAPRPP